MMKELNNPYEEQESQFCSEKESLEKKNDRAQ